MKKLIRKLEKAIISMDKIPEDCPWIEWDDYRDGMTIIGLRLSMEEACRLERAGQLQFYAVYSLGDERVSPFSADFVVFTAGLGQMFQARKEYLIRRENYINYFLRPAQWGLA